MPVMPSPTVTVANPLLDEITEWDEFTGRMYAVKSVEVRPRVSGYLKSVNFMEGTIVSMPLVRYSYQAPELLVFNDSGVGVAKDGDPGFVNDTLLAGWNASALVPASCPQCTSNGHVTRLIEWQLAADENFTMSALSYSADRVIFFSFLMIPPEDFTTSLLAETGRTTAMFEDRYKRFIPEDTAHTALLNEGLPEDIGGFKIGGLQTAIDGVTVLDWFAAMVDGTDAWDDLVDETLE